MKLRHTWKGDEALTKAFRQLSDAVSHDVAIEALTMAAEPIRRRAEALAPRSSGRGPHLADNIIVSETTRVRGFGGSGRWKDVGPGVSAVAIGPSYRPHDLFYGQFQEFGTANHPAQPFLRPAFDAERKQTQQRLASLLWLAMTSRLKGAA